MEGELDAKVDTRKHELPHTLAYAENITATLREPFVVLDKGLRVRTANAAFYRNLSSRSRTSPECRPTSRIPFSVSLAVDRCLRLRFQSV